VYPSNCVFLRGERGANFYEKALFVKTDVAVAPCGRVQLLCALRALCFYPL
jgi:hypothetical protein